MGGAARRACPWMNKTLMMPSAPPSPMVLKLVTRDVLSIVQDYCLQCERQAGSATISMILARFDLLTSAVFVVIQWLFTTLSAQRSGRATSVLPDYQVQGQVYDLCLSMDVRSPPWTLPSPYVLILGYSGNGAIPHHMVVDRVKVERQTKFLKGVAHAKSSIDTFSQFWSSSSSGFP